MKKKQKNNAFSEKQRGKVSEVVIILCDTPLTMLHGIKGQTDQSTFVTVELNFEAINLLVNIFNLLITS